MRWMFQVSAISAVLLAVCALEFTGQREYAALDLSQDNPMVASCPDSATEGGAMVCGRAAVAGNCTTGTMIRNAQCPNGGPVVPYAAFTCNPATASTACTAQQDIQAATGDNDTAVGPGVSCGTYTVTPCNAVPTNTPVNCPSGVVQFVGATTCVPGQPTTPSCGFKSTSVGAGC
jgi:hypothetical protein